MSRATRGARSRRGPLLTLAAMAAVVTGGAGTLLGFANVLRDVAGDAAGDGAAAEISPWLVLPLLVIGAVAVPAVGHELAVERRGEIGLARLHGVHGRRLVVFLLGEPLAAVILGALAGLGLGVAGTWLTTTLWLTEAGLSPSSWTLVVAAGVVVVGVVGVGAGVAAAAREPLADQVAIASRRRPASAAALFGSALVLLAATFAIYRRGGDGDPDLLVLAGPALVGLAAGQLTVWLLRGTARVATARTATGGLPGFLASRRVGRGVDRSTSLRLLVAAGAVATLAATGAVGVAGWSDDSARLTAGAPVRVDVDVDAQQVLALTQEEDPLGRWLMPAVVVPASSAAERRAYVDTGRFEAVAGDHYDDTPAAGVSDQLAALRPEQTNPPVIGSRLVLGLAAVPLIDLELPPDVRPAVRLYVDYVTLDGQSERAQVTLERDGDSPVVGRTEVADCAAGCYVTGLEIESAVLFPDDISDSGDNYFVPEAVRGDALLTTLRFGDADLLATRWDVAGDEGYTDFQAGRIRDTGNALRVVFPELGGVEARAVDAAAELPVLQTPAFPWAEGDRTVDDPSGTARPVRVVGRLPALPLVGGTGVLADLPAALAGAGPTVPAAEVMVLAAADTPPNVLAQLREAGGTVRTLDEIGTDLRLASGAVTASVYAVLAGCCLVVAVLALLASGARQRAAYRADVAALRLLGVSSEQIRSAGARELVLLGSVAVVAGAGAGLLAAGLLLGDLPLVEVPEFAIPLRPVSSVLPAIGTGLLLALLVGVVAGRGRRLDLDATRPAILRDEQWAAASGAHR